MVIADKPLSGIRVLVTRPRQQASALIEAIEQAGGQAILFPVIAIEAIPVSEWQQPDWQQVNWLVFVSSNAVHSFTEQSPAINNWSIQYAAVGDGTAKAMLAAGLNVDLRPVDAVGSEGLLAMPEWQDMQGQQVVIVRGQGGREHLAETLIARGASIRYIEVYKRCLPEVSETECQQALTADYLLCTSVAGVDNLCALLGEAVKVLLNKSLIVLSERIKQHAQQRGFENVSVTTAASDAAVMMQLTEMETGS